jgi:hypothetical protein
MDGQLDVLCSQGPCHSVLGSKFQNLDGKNLATNAIGEMAKAVPFLFKVLVTCASSTSGKPEWLIAVIYGMLLYRRNQRVNAMQQIFTAACLRYNAGNQVRLNKKIN